MLSTVHSGIPELIDSDDSGWLVAENDAEALADKLRLMGSMDEQGLQPVVTRARKKVETDFNQQLINRQLASLLHTLC